MPQPTTVDPSPIAPTPRGQQRRQAVLDAALALFLEQGFAATSLDKIIERAGGSRRTIYQTFGGKEGLLEAVVTESCREILAQMSATALDSLSPKAALTHIAERFLAVLMQPERAALFRLVVAESTHAPKLGRLFMEAGPDSAHALVCDYLGKAVAAGKLEMDDLEIGASQFLEMVKGDLHFRALFYGESADAALQKRHVQSAVTIFLSGTLPSKHRQSTPPAD
ncbi:TetR/AcrR family transcriptional regulator [Parahaliea mediterranea]|uniref:TetR/AcrR family transcriptional regulator n=1 Tax=Parahaliea mediterranea TaxID=651086 RepID=UPI001474D4E8|nr:TetR/AcrR family transcriptional regulator [Parahaliea mediterranea]